MTDQPAETFTVFCPLCQDEMPGELNDSGAVTIPDHACRGRS